MNTKFPICFPVFISQKMHDALRDLARADKKSMSHVMRGLIADECARRAAAAPADAQQLTPLPAQRFIQALYGVDFIDFRAEYRATAVEIVRGFIAHLNNDVWITELELHFGLRDGAARTLQEIGDAFGVSRERVRQIEAKSLCKLRYPPLRRDFLEKFLTETEV